MFIVVEDKGTIDADLAVFNYAREICSCCSCEGESKIISDQKSRKNNAMVLIKLLEGNNYYSYGSDKDSVIGIETVCERTRLRENRFQVYKLFQGEVSFALSISKNFFRKCKTSPWKIYSESNGKVSTQNSSGFFLIIIPITRLIGYRTNE